MDFNPDQLDNTKNVTGFKDTGGPISQTLWLTEAQYLKGRSAWRVSIQLGDLLDLPDPLGHLVLQRVKERRVLNFVAKIRDLEVIICF